ncbi:MAG TPA: cyclopropane-fatty-acyl-phospholipid synthase family protein, partial [Gammaproteobacteria bacterium]|nr:cyclopropane-fatty-acyl-phospholipid synthase family protein [Gammaproteobacteria bacterium]
MNTARQADIELPKPLPLAARVLIKWLSGLRRGRLEGVLPDGRSFLIQAPQPGPGGVIILHAPTRMLFRTATRGAVGFGESYMAGEWASPDPAGLLELLGANEDHLDRQSQGTWMGRLAMAMHHRRNANTHTGSRRNIQAHYDLGNDFYRLWLDDTMTYSGAVFERRGQPLEDAQRHKYRALLDRLGIRPGNHILEIGCGWGGLAEEAAARGAHVTGITLSTEQLAYGRERLERAGLAGRVELRLQDYRDVRGEYDHIVSIEMLEAVGQAYWPTYFDVLAHRVRPGGGIALH